VWESFRVRAWRVGGFEIIRIEGYESFCLRIDEFQCAKAGTLLWISVGELENLRSGELAEEWPRN
jgi:hypothetical protein